MRRRSGVVTTALPTPRTTPPARPSAPESAGCAIDDAEPSPAAAVNRGCRSPGRRWSGDDGRRPARLPGSPATRPARRRAAPPAGDRGAWIPPRLGPSTPHDSAGLRPGTPRTPCSKESPGPRTDTGSSTSPGRKSVGEASSTLTQGSCRTVAVRRVSCNLGALGPNASARARIRVRARVAGEAVNTARATSAVPDPDRTNNRASATTNVLPAAPAETCAGHEATIVGTDGDDTLVGTDKRDVIVGLSAVGQRHDRGPPGRGRHLRQWRLRLDQQPGRKRHRPQRRGQRPEAARPAAAPTRTRSPAARATTACAHRR